MLTQTLTLAPLVGGRPRGRGHHPGAREPHAAAAGLLLGPALIVVASSSGGRSSALGTQVQDALAASTTTAEEALGGIRVVKSFVREDWEVGRYDADLAGVVAHATRLIAWRRRVRRGHDLPGLRRARGDPLVHGPPGDRRHAHPGRADRASCCTASPSAPAWAPSRACTASSAKAPAPSRGCSSCSTSEPTITDPVPARPLGPRGGPHHVRARLVRVRRRPRGAARHRPGHRAGRGARAGGAVGGRQDHGLST